MQHDANELLLNFIIGESLTTVRIKLELCFDCHLATYVGGGRGAGFLIAFGDNFETDTGIVDILCGAIVSLFFITAAGRLKRFS